MTRKSKYSPKKLRKITIIAILFAILFSLILVGGIKLYKAIEVINSNIVILNDKIDSLNNRSDELQNAIDMVDEQVDKQKEVNDKLIKALEKQNGIDTFEASTPIYYSGLSDRSSISSIPRTITINTSRIDPIVRLAGIETAQNITIEKQDRIKNDFSTFRSKSNGNTDLGAYVNVDEATFNKWIASKAPKGSPFIGNAKVFLKASQETGLDPRYILAHAALESAWGTSTMARKKHNYFGIAAYDSNPGAAKVMGYTLEEGIINGAKWINDHYYKKGRTTLNKMKAAGYATSSDWVSQIVAIMQVSNKI